MSDRQAFLRAIRANPDDDTARLAFADWLDEHDEPERAEFIRLQIELEPIRFRIDNPRAVELHAREDALLRQHGGDWTGTDHLLTNPADFGPVFRRGLPERACLSLDTFLASGEALFDAHPTLREVALYGVANRCSELTLSPLLAKLDTLEIADWPTEDDAISLSVSPHLDKIARFKLWLGGDPYFLRELVKQATARWPREIELVQVFGGLAHYDAEARRQLNEEADIHMSGANGLLKRGAVRVMRPFDQLFPLCGDLGYHLRAGHLPDGSPALAAGSFDQWLLVVFTADGRLRDVQAQDSPVEGTGPGDYGNLDTAFREWVDEERRLEPRLIWVREFAVEDLLRLELWEGLHLERIANPSSATPGAWNEADWRDQCGYARGWLEHRNFVVGWFNEYWADWRGKIHSS